MRISTKGRYGTRAMLALAEHYDQGLMTANTIAVRHHISLKYLENILSTLKSARLITSTRGKCGGYRLSRPPQKILLREVLEPLEDALDIVHCTEDGSSCKLNESCCLQELWLRLKHAVDGILTDVSLADLMERQKALAKRRARAHGPQRLKEH